MTKPTNCTIDGCTHEVNARGWCLFHYKRWHQTGTPHRLCKGCGGNMPEDKRNYCSTACRPRCSIEGCGKPQSAKGWCKTHYNRVSKWGTPDRRAVHCEACGCLYDAGHMGHNSKWCSEACKPRCSIDECERSAQSHGWCTLHYRRHLTHGDPLRTDRPEWATEWVCVACGAEVEKGSGRRRHCSSRCQQRDHRARRGTKPKVRIPEGEVPIEQQCSIDSCVKQRDYKLYCSMHHSRWKRTGDPLTPPKRKIGGNGSCEMCGKKIEKSRRTCSSACRALVLMYGESRPRETECELCGTPIDLMERVGKSNRLRQVTSTLCDKCRIGSGAWRVHKEDLILRDFYVCGICRTVIDPDIKWPDRHSLTIDHITPRSRGGSDDLDNLQLAHAGCNSRKNNRLDFKGG